MTVLMKLYFFFFFFKDTTFVTRRTFGRFDFVIVVVLSYVLYFHTALRRDGI